MTRSGWFSLCTPAHTNSAVALTLAMDVALFLGDRQNADTTDDRKWGCACLSLIGMKHAPQEHISILLKYPVFVFFTVILFFQNKWSLCKLDLKILIMAAIKNMLLGQNETLVRGLCTLNTLDPSNHLRHQCWLSHQMNWTLIKVAINLSRMLLSPFLCPLIFFLQLCCPSFAGFHSRPI